MYVQCGFIFFPTIFLLNDSSSSAGVLIKTAIIKKIFYLLNFLQNEI